ncbi:hypothetical protein J2T02_004864 [Chitinophaga terrae (ex Kim and Jung 2007)]|uniref:hypothetical protein n=1 Tax=Chitinophaga terrae (ex Kim and Jung 2007) TaxID=408074 RepID=UPI0027889FFC|nr:hypothetical protein [Chitinophaga terrae (ex Kim and Jung 2007)]MDQ0109720.1 hypothetical protein [Chitinophaga terrae (ex Kim and Jung 2007)]
MQKEFVLSPGEGHFFFGFHDLVAWNFTGNKLLALQAPDITAPPDPRIACGVGYFDAAQQFRALGKTYAYNYPQGARQQWIGETDTFIVNDRVGEKWGSRIYDADNDKCVATLPLPAHVITDKGVAFGLDYARLFRVGGYGYTGLPDKQAHIHAPADSGITVHNIYTGEQSLLLSVAAVANYRMNPSLGQHHYITHLLLNPSQNRLAFLHRYKLKDGGETTRLMTVGTDGSGLACLATGFLSHFDWKDDRHIAIWGRTGSGIEKLRGSLLYKMMPAGLIANGKKVLKKLLYTREKGAKAVAPFNWLLLEDTDNAVPAMLAKDIITEDGHPMFCPANRDWMICDTYPDQHGIRTLFLFQYSTQKKTTLGTYRMIDTKPDLQLADRLLEGVDEGVLKAFSLEQMAFTRSGLHCDLHPRWKRDGSLVAFDSIHEGHRMIYGYDVSSIVHANKKVPV